MHIWFFISSQYSVPVPFSPSQFITSCPTRGNFGFLSNMILFRSILKLNSCLQQKVTMQLGQKHFSQSTISPLQLQDVHLGAHVSFSYCNMGSGAQAHTLTYTWQLSWGTGLEVRNDQCLVHPVHSLLHPEDLQQPYSVTPIDHRMCFKFKEPHILIPNHVVE